MEPCYWAAETLLSEAPVGAWIREAAACLEGGLVIHRRAMLDLASVAAPSPES